MRSLQNKTNVDSPDSDYPYGKIKDKTFSESGTPVNEDVYGDFHQFFEKLMDEGDQTSNELPENAYSGFQLFLALQKFGVKNFSQDLFLALTESYTTNDVIILHGCEIDANIGGTSTITAGAIYYNGNIYKIDADSISTPSDTIVFQIDESVQPAKAYIENGTTGSGIVDYTDLKAIKGNVYLDNSDHTNYFTFTPGGSSNSVTITRLNVFKEYNRIKIQGNINIGSAGSINDQLASVNTSINDDFEILNAGGPDVTGLYKVSGVAGFNSPIIIGRVTDSISKGYVSSDSYTITNHLNIVCRTDVSGTGATCYFECEYLSSNPWFRPYQF